MTPFEQFRVLLAMMACGAALGVFYDALWLLRTAFFRGAVWMAALDLLFALGCAAGVIAAALLLRVDVLRLYTLGAAAAGMAIYRGSAGAMLRYCVRWIEKMIKIWSLKAKNEKFCRKSMKKEESLTYYTQMEERWFEKDTNEKEE